MHPYRLVGTGPLDSRIALRTAQINSDTAHQRVYTLRSIAISSSAAIAEIEFTESNTVQSAPATPGEIVGHAEGRGTVRVKVATGELVDSHVVGILQVQHNEPSLPQRSPSRYDLELRAQE